MSSYNKRIIDKANMEAFIKRERNIRQVQAFINLIG
jgi:hypothetical protein